MRARMPDYLKGSLVNALTKLRSLHNPKDTKCGVKVEHKKAVHGYISSWIEPELLKILAWAAHNDGETLDMMMKKIINESGGEG